MPDTWGRSPSDGRPFFCSARRLRGAAVLYLIIKAALSGVIVAAVSEVARRYPGWGGLVASLPLTSLLAMIWLWRDTGQPERVAALSVSTIWFFLPSMPLFIVLPLLLYALMFWAAPRLGLKL
jgi:DNA-binding transcriptional LysR family regulator